MKMNKNMRELLSTTGIEIAQIPRLFPSSSLAPALIRVGDSIFLREEYAGAKHVSLSDFSDLTGLECFINHVHFSARDSRDLLSVFRYVLALEEGLRPFCTGRSFLIIVSVADGRSTVRFHECRLGQNWLANDLDGYKDEALLTLHVQADV